MTAAHCIVDETKDSVQVLLGEHNYLDHDYFLVDVAQIIQHQYYNETTMNNDVAILVLAKPISFTRTMKPVCLPADTESQYALETATVTGWGSIMSGGPSSNILQEVDVTVWPEHACRNAYGQEGYDITRY